MSDAAHDWSPRSISFNKNDGLPKYVAISRAIEAAIVEEELRAGEPLPSQKDLAEHFGVTVMTVRQALQVLIDKGMLKTEQGRGTFVHHQPYRLSLGRLASFTAQIEESGHTARTEVLGYAPAEVSPLEQSRMALPNREAYELVRLRYINDEPLILQTSLLPPHLGSRLVAAQLESRSLYDLLDEEFGVRVARATETVSAMVLDSESAALLGCQPGEPGLMMSRLTMSQDGEPVVDDRALSVSANVVVSVDRQVDEPGMAIQLSPGLNPHATGTRRFIRGALK